MGLIREVVFTGRKTSLLDSIQKGFKAPPKFSSRQRSTETVMNSGAKSQMRAWFFPCQINVSRTRKLLLVPVGCTVTHANECALGYERVTNVGLSRCPPQ